jgi:hypothetical protein
MDLAVVEEVVEAAAVESRASLEEDDVSRVADSRRS